MAVVSLSVSSTLVLLSDVTFSPGVVLQYSLFLFSGLTKELCLIEGRYLFEKAFPYTQMSVDYLKPRSHRLVGSETSHRDSILYCTVLREKCQFSVLVESGVGLPFDRLSLFRFVTGLVG